MKRIRPNIFCLLVLAAILAGCQTPPPPETASPSPEPAPVQAAPTPAAEYEFDTLPVTKEAIEVFYPQEGYTVKKITPWEGDFLVEYSYGEHWSGLDWVFGESGRRVRMAADGDYASYDILRTGEVRYTTTGSGWLPETHEITVLGDAFGRLDLESCLVETAEVSGEQTVWADPATPYQFGQLTGDGNISGRPEQIYDARIDADGLSFTFIPKGDSIQSLNAFVAACTGLPAFDTSFDKSTRQFTLRFHNTSLESGGITEEEIRAWSNEPSRYPQYPYSFPAGSLGRDNHFLTDAQIMQDGEDTVVTCILTEKAYRFTVESDNLGGDTIPLLRVHFREYDRERDGEP